MDFQMKNPNEIPESFLEWVLKMAAFYDQSQYQKDLKCCLKTS